MRSVSCLLLRHFYATIAEQTDPALAGKPFLITRGNKIIDTSPAAADAGVSLPTTLRLARHTCPEILAVPCRNDYFDWVKPLLDECSGLTPLVEPFTFDGIYLDFTGCGPLQPLVRKIEITLEELGFEGGLGLAGNKPLARIAAQVCLSRLPGEKIVHISAGAEREFLSGLPLRYLNIPGWMEEKLVQLGIYSMKELLSSPRQLLLEQFGPGINKIISSLLEEGEPVTAAYPPEGITYRVNVDAFGGEICDFSSLQAALWEAAENIAGKLKEQGRACREIEVAFESGGCTCNRRTHLKEALTDEERIFYALKRLLESLPAPLTALHIIVRGVPFIGTQLSIFAGLEVNKQSKINAAIDSLEDRFGPQSIKKAASLPMSRRERMLRLYFESGL